MKIRNKVTIWLAAAAFTIAMRLLFRTLRLEFRLEHPGTSPYGQPNGESYIYCLWHDSIVIAAFGGEQRNSLALTSRHTDGSFVAEVLRLINVKTIRGSTNRITPAAVRELIRASKTRNIVIAPDGPRGPNHQMSAGIVHLASSTGQAVIPTAYSCNRCWRIKGSWSDLIVPKPFARVYLLAAKPVYVPADLPSDGRQEYLANLQSEMNRLVQLADRLATGVA